RSEGICFGNAAALALLGLGPGRHQTPEEVNGVTLSAEDVEELDADYVFIWAMDEDAKERLEDKPGYDSSRSVQAGTASFIDTDSPPPSTLRVRPAWTG